MKKGRMDDVRRRSPLEESGDVNPMEGLGNLADTMLVLAVGIMLALVMAWNVDFSADTSQEQLLAAGEEKAVEELAEAGVLDKSETVSMNGDGLTEYGKVYVDAKGNLYVEANSEN